MIKKDNTMNINLDVKSNLAKLLATENITIQHNNVKTASFDVKNRVLTLPIFKQKSGDVYDMLIAHECAHALWTPYEEWKGIDDDELRSYVNVLEDTRIDKLIQAKYPGVVRNYQNGFDLLEKQNFFGIGGKDINKDLMIIDKINLRSKSLNRLPFMFAPKDNEWLAKVDSLVTFNDVLALAKEQYPIYPMSLMLKDHFDSISLAESVRSPVLVVAGGKDSLIPLNHSKKLVTAIGKQQVTLVVIDNAGHNNISQFSVYFQRLRSFLGAG